VGVTAAVVLSFTRHAPQHREPVAVGRPGLCRGEALLVILDFAHELCPRCDEGVPAVQARDAFVQLLMYGPEHSRRQEQLDANAAVFEELRVTDRANEVKHSLGVSLDQVGLVHAAATTTTPPNPSGLPTSCMISP
jgi:hypothetical protein